MRRTLIDLVFTGGFSSLVYGVHLTYGTEYAFIIGGVIAMTASILAQFKR